MIGWRGQWEEGAGTPEPPEMQITKKLWEKMTKNSEDKYYKNKSVGRGVGTLEPPKMQIATPKTNILPKQIWEKMPTKF